MTLIEEPHGPAVSSSIKMVESFAMKLPINL